MPAALDVCVQADRGRGEELERLRQGRQLGRDFSQLRKPEWANVAGSHAVAHFEQIVRVGEHERAVGEVEHVELDEVDIELHGAAEGRQRVLGLERRGAAMTDPQHAGAAAKPPQVLRITTTAQSSVRSPPVKTRQSSTTARASWAAGSPAFAASSASSRSSP